MYFHRSNLAFSSYRYKINKGRHMRKEITTGEISNKQLLAEIIKGNNDLKRHCKQ